MQDNINFELFDRFRRFNRMLRMGRTPGAFIPNQPEFQVPPRDPMMRREAILIVLFSEGSSMKQKDVAEELHISPSTISEMIGKLKAEGLLEQKTDPEDARAVQLALTEKGMQRAECIIEIGNSMFGYIFRNLTDEEKCELIRLLDKVVSDQ